MMSMINDYYRSEFQRKIQIASVSKPAEETPLFGMFVGGVVSTRLMRVLSPRRVYISGILGLICCGVSTGVVNDFSLHCSFRCLSGVSCCFMMTSGQVICRYTTSFHCYQVL